MMLKFSGSYQDIRRKLQQVSEEWDESQTNKKVLRLDSGVMNWFETTGTITFQGREPGKSRLETEVPKLLYPSEDAITNAQIVSDSVQEACSVPPMSTTVSSERLFLTSGVNDGELIIGIVSAVGTESKRVTESLTDRLQGFGYSVQEIRVSSCLDIFNGKGEYDRIKHYMREGDRLREASKNDAILAAGVAKKISESRDKSYTKRAYIVNSLKHPREVEFLRKVYGNGFYLIGIHAEEKRRHKYLTEDKGMAQAEAMELIHIDEDENIDHGQKTRDTYHLADFFLNLGSNSDEVKNRLQRFLELIFSHPYRNPTFDEFAMFMAFNSSVRSGDLSRQVGAVVSRANQIIATGANDVPKSGGGLYWAEDDGSKGMIEDIPDGKDYTREGDSNKQTQAQIIQEIANSLVAANLVDKGCEEELQRVLGESKISDLTEFGRVVHAEMDALLSCSRAGIPTIGATLYCTTFPCHNCAKHIIASGIHRLVYVEPYPKSRALDFHSESIQLKSELSTESGDTGKLVIFEPFIGVGPRRFLDLFSMSLGAGSKLRRKDKKGNTLEWDRTTAPTRTPLISSSYLQIEQAATEMWNECSQNSRPTNGNTHGIPKGR